MALALTGGYMNQIHNEEFERLQQWFNPRKLRDILKEWRARYEPWVYEHPDERGFKPMRGKADMYESPEMSRAMIAGSVKKALNQLAMEEPGLFDIIVGFYLDVEPVYPDKATNPHEIVWQPRQTVFQLAEWQGIHPRTVYKRELRARHWLAERLGWQAPEDD